MAEQQTGQRGTRRAASHRRLSSAVIYRGPSILDGAPIVVIATGLGRPSANVKTGAMVQTFVVREDVAPGAAIRDGSDASVCGGCPHRRFTGGDCYVDVDKSVRSTWGAMHRGTIPDVAPATVGALARELGRGIRMGAYGDPGAVPGAVWDALWTGQSRHTGYSHQWRIRPDLRPVAMASVDSRAEAVEAQSAGWRTFRVLSRGEQLLPGEIICPASKEASRTVVGPDGKAHRIPRTTCARCGLCDGSRGAADPRASIAITAH